MESVTEFFEQVKGEETALLATSSGGSVTVRTVSPVVCGDAILIFTSPQSRKYRQLQENPNCCLVIGGSFLEARAEFAGHAMADGNEALRSCYDEKFHGAFDADIEFGGRDSDFILFRPVALSGWDYKSGAPVPFQFTCQ